MIVNIVYALVATLGFGIIFNIRGRNLLFASFGGGLTWFVYLLMLYFKQSNIFSLFIASILAGIYSEVMARVMKTPVTTFVICALIPLVPGGGMYYTMFDVVTGDIAKSQSMGLQTLSNAGSIAVGVVFVSSATRLITFWRKQKTSRK